MNRQFDITGGDGIAQVFQRGSREKGEDRVDKSVEEYHVVKLVVAELPDVDPKTDEFKAKMTDLKELIEHHVEEEQEEMFPAADEKLGKERLDQLGENMQARVGELGQ